jgi:hypothetical protein
MYQAPQEPLLVDENRLGVGEELASLVAVFGAHAGLLVPAEGNVDAPRDCPDAVKVDRLR